MDVDIKEENVEGGQDADGAPPPTSSGGGSGDTAVIRVRADLASLPDPSQFLAEEPEIPDPSGSFGGISSSTSVTRVTKGKKRKAPSSSDRLPLPEGLEEGQIHTPEMSMSVGDLEYEDDPVAATRKINAMPTEVCPICGDKANGVHYGIYTCEACKNFFKRSVVSNSSKNYVCKFAQNCNIATFEEDGTRRKGTRCQFCRFEACLAAGMTYNGQRGTRTPRKTSNKNSVDPWANAMANVSVSMGDGSNGAEHEGVAGNFYEHYLSSTSMEDTNGEEEPIMVDPTFYEQTHSSPHSSSHNTPTKMAKKPASGGKNQHNNEEDRSFQDYVSSIQSLNAERMRSEINQLQSRVRELETVVVEKNEQLAQQSHQIDILKKQGDLRENLSGKSQGMKRENGNGTKEANSGMTLLERLTNGNISLVNK